MLRLLRDKQVSPLRSVRFAPVEMAEFALVFLTKYAVYRLKIYMGMIHEADRQRRVGGREAFSRIIAWDDIRRWGFHGSQ